MTLNPNACCCGGDAANGHLVECPGSSPTPRFPWRPGPWRVQGDAGVVDAHGREVCTVDTDRELDDNQAQAIAEAIAALGGC